VFGSKATRRIEEAISIGSITAPPLAAAAGRRARTARRVGDAQRRPVDDPEDRNSILDKTDVGRELAVPGDSLRP